MKRIGKWVLIVFAGLALLVLLAMVLAPGYIKDYILEHDLELLGREMRLDDISIGWFSGEIALRGLEIREQDSSKVFVAVDEVFTELSISALFENHIHLKAFRLTELHVEVVQNGASFNFDDLAASSPDTTTQEPSEPWRFTMENFSIDRGSINYSSDIAPFIGLDSIDVHIPLITESMTEMEAASRFLFKTGGELLADLQLDFENSTYTVHVDAERVGLGLVEPYFTNVIDVQKVDGNFLADFNVFGSWSDTDVLNLSGTLGLQDFIMTDPRGEALASCKSLEIAVDSIRLKDAVYNIDYIRARGLYGIYEMYDDGDNFTNLMVGDTMAVESGVEGEEELDYSNPFAILAHYIQGALRSYQESTYRVKQIDLAESSFEFNDYTPTDPFRYKLTELRVFADSLFSSRDKFTIHMGAVLNGMGTFEGDFTSYTANLEDMDIAYAIKGTGLTPFAPYTSFYVAHPIEYGEMLYTCETTIRNGVIESKNYMLFEDFTFGNRAEGAALYDLPVRLAVSLLKDLDGNIELEVPIEGDLKDPNYRLGKVIWNTVKNILLKAVTAPFRLLAKTFQVDEDNLKQVRFGLLERELDKVHRAQLNDLAKVMETKEELNVEFKRVTDRYEEVEKHAIQEATRRYLFDGLAEEALDKDQKDELEAFDIKDSLFGVFIDAGIPSSDLSLPIQRKCLIFIGEAESIAAVDKIGTRRATAISDFLVEEKGIESGRLKFTIVPDDSLITSRSTAIYNIGFWVEDP